LIFDRITVRADQMGGIPCIRGLRVPVATIVGMVADGMASGEILAAYPDLEPANVEQALRYAADAVRETELTLSDAAETPIQEVFRLLVEDEQRTTLVCDDVLAALAEGRRCLVLSHWKQHWHLLAEALRSRGVSPLVFEGGLGKRARAPRCWSKSRTLHPATTSS